jgi:hypothetical protein
MSIYMKRTVDTLLENVELQYKIDPKQAYDNLTEAKSILDAYEEKDARLKESAKFVVNGFLHASRIFYKDCLDPVNGEEMFNLGVKAAEEFGLRDMYEEGLGKIARRLVRSYIEKRNSVNLSKNPADAERLRYRAASIATKFNFIEEVINEIQSRLY